MRKVSLAAVLALLLACAASPLVFAAVQGEVALLVAPALSGLGISSRAGLHAVLAAASLLGSLTAAAILCLPVGWLGAKHSVVFGSIVGLAGGILIARISPPLPASDSVLLGLHWLEVAVFVVGCVVFSTVGAFGARRVAA